MISSPPCGPISLTHKRPSGAKATPSMLRWPIVQNSSATPPREAHGFPGAGWPSLVSRRTLPRLPPRSCAGSHFLPVARGQVEEAVGTEGDAVREVAVALDLGRLAPDDLEIRAAAAGRCPFQACRNRAPRRSARLRPARHRSDRPAGCRRSPGRRRHRRDRPAPRPWPAGPPRPRSWLRSPHRPATGARSRSDSNAMLVVRTPLPGRKSSAHGLSKVATSAMAKGGSAASASGAVDTAHPASASAAAPCISPALVHIGFILVAPDAVVARASGLERPMPAAQLLSLATAVPPFIIDQPQAKAIGRRAFRRKAAFDRLSGVFDNAGIAAPQPRRAARMVRAPPWLGRAQPGLSRGGRGAVRGSRAGGDREGRA